MKRAMVLTALMCLTVLSGCLESGSYSTSAAADGAYGTVPAAALGLGHYQFEHRGGSVSLSVDADHYARFDLFNGDDARLGRVELGQGGFANEISIAGDAGQYVINIIELVAIPDDENETTPDGGILRIESGGKPVDTFQLLGVHVERIVLVDRSFQGGVAGTPINIGMPRGDPLSVVQNVTLERTPIDLRILAAGYATDLSVRGRGSGGILFETDTGYNIPESHLESIGRAYYPENVQNAELQISLDAPQQEGPIVLEAYSFSRHLPPTVAGLTVRALEHPSETVAFTYGELPGRPTRVELSANAAHIHAWTEPAVPAEGTDAECETGEACSGARTESSGVTATFALYDPHDARVGTFTVHSGQRLDIPIAEGGSYVLIAESGPVFIGADAAPRDFQMHPLEIQQHELGVTSPGERYSYGAHAANVSVPGTVYEISPAHLNPFEGNIEDIPSAFQSCSTDGTIRVLLNGETLAAAGDGWPTTFLDGNQRLTDGALRFVQEGFDGNCGQMGLLVSTYLR